MGKVQSMWVLQCHGKWKKMKEIKRNHYLATHLEEEPLVDQVLLRLRLVGELALRIVLFNQVHKNCARLQLGVQDESESGIPSRF